MRNKDIEARINDAIEHTTPDVLDRILMQCDTQQVNMIIHQNKRWKPGWLRVASMLGSFCILLMAGLFTVNWTNDLRPETLVMLDVNPRIELSLNRYDRVLNAAAKNEDAIRVLDNMDLRDTHINVAINALIGSMLRYGYIQENANTVLLSFTGADGEKIAILQKTLTDYISNQLELVNGAVLSQNLSNDKTVQQLADEYHISHGKAALVQKIIQKNNHLTFAEIAGLSVNELALLASSKNIHDDGMETQGNASDTDYIGMERAKYAAFKHAGINEYDTEHLRIELDYDDGYMVYEVEFICVNLEYEYEINAIDGSIIEYDRESIID